jgi:hypothetical protein
MGSCYVALAGLALLGSTYPDSASGVTGTTGVYYCIYIFNPHDLSLCLLLFSAAHFRSFGKHLKTEIVGHGGALL